MADIKLSNGNFILKLLSYPPLLLKISYFSFNVPFNHCMFKKFVPLFVYLSEVILEQLKHGTAKFELVSSPVPSISTLNSQTCSTATFLGDNSHRFFARIAPSQ